MRLRLMLGGAALVAAFPAAAEVADKEPSVGWLWAWALAFNVAALALEALRPRLGLLVSPVAALFAWAAYRELSDPHIGPAIVSELGPSYISTTYLTYAVSTLGPLIVVALSAILRRRKA